MKPWTLTRFDANQPGSDKLGSIIIRQKTPDGFIERIFEEMEKGDFVFHIGRKAKNDPVGIFIKIGSFNIDDYKTEKNKRMAELVKNYIQIAKELEKLIQ